MNRSQIIFFVEGKMERILVNSLDILGNAMVLNLTQTSVKRKLPALSKTVDTIYIVYDSDVLKEPSNIAMLKANIELHEARGKHVFLVQQTENLEDELCRAGYHNRKALFEAFGAAGINEFKNKFCHVGNLTEKLRKDGFDPNKLWTKPLAKGLKKYSSKKRSFADLERKDL